MSAHTDLIRLADKNDGKIPSTIPAHYIRWAYEEHRYRKNLPVVTLKYQKIRDGVIKA